MEHSTKTVLNTMNGPQNLRQPVQIYHLPRFSPQMVGSKRPMIGWVPVLCSHHEVKLWNQIIGNRNNVITVLYL